jgi:hypothetical protein
MGVRQTMVMDTETEMGLDMGPDMGPDMDLVGVEGIGAMAARQAEDRTRESLAEIPLRQPLVALPP